MQLHATLESFAAHDKGLIDESFVLYSSSSPEYQAGYDLLVKRFPRVEFVKEKVFHQDLKWLLDSQWTLFAADDDIAFGDLDREVLEAITDRDACFSLRLGLNITYCYSNDKPNTLADWIEEGPFIRWKWRKEVLDFGYPLSVVSHVFRTSEIRQFTQHNEFRNPNEYESSLQPYLKYVRPEMVAYPKSRIVGVPANRVNVSCPNRNGLTHAYSTEDLLISYLNGDAIDLSKMDFSGINAAQQELEYVFHYHPDQE